MRFNNGELIPGKPPRSLRTWTIRSGIVPTVIGIITPKFLIFTTIGELIEAFNSQKKLSQMNWTLTHGFFLCMGGFCLETPAGYACSSIKTHVQQLLTKVQHLDWYSKLQRVKEYHITDHVKSNSLSKFIACSQALWLVAQVITRVCHDQAVTPLEVSAPPPTQPVRRPLTSRGGKSPRIPPCPSRFRAPMDSCPKREQAWSIDWRICLGGSALERPFR